MKYKSSIKQCVNKYSVSPTVFCEYEIEGETSKGVLAKFPTKESINNKKKVFNNSSINPMELERILRIKANALSVSKIIDFKCAVVGCNNDAKQTYYIRELGRRLRGRVISALSFQVLQGWEKLEFELRRKQVLFCIPCYIKVEKGEIMPDDFDLKFIFDINKKAL